MSLTASDSFIRPPWLEYPESDPTWGGWRQGISEQWFLHVWLPFWKKLDEDGRAIYLAHYPPPDAEWSFYLRNVWSIEDMKV